VWHFDGTISEQRIGRPEECKLTKTGDSELKLKVAPSPPLNEFDHAFIAGSGTALGIRIVDAAVSMVYWHEIH
jgi:hypothetical protein